MDGHELGVAPIRDGDRAVIRRLFFVVFFLCGGFVFYIPKWILMGTKGSRDRKRLIRLTERQNELLERRDGPPA